VKHFSPFQVSRNAGAGGERLLGRKQPLDPLGRILLGFSGESFGRAVGVRRGRGAAIDICRVCV
jgi:hypothetical protein